MQKNTLKRILMYGIVLVGVMFVGFMAYYFARNDETIALTTVSEGEEVYLNSGSSIKLPIEHKDPYAGTTITVSSSNEEVVSYIESTKALYANNGGVATITITTSNKDFGPFMFDILVGDGSEENPWYISSALQFSRIGQPAQGEDIEFSNQDHYELISNINLSTLYTADTFWTPIAQFYGSLSGEGHTINNLKIESTDANVGLFGKLNSKAKVENVKFENVEITATGSSYVGVVAGINNGYIGKVYISGSVSSTSNTAFVGGVVGANDFQGVRPTLNMVAANVSFVANGFVGGLVGINNGGIIFNSYANTTDLDIFGETGVISFGGLVSSNNAIIISINEENLFRQSAIKNSYAILNAQALLARSQDNASRLALIVYSNTDLPLMSHEYATNNEYYNLVAQEYNSAPALRNAATLNNVTIVSALSMGSTNTFSTWDESVWILETLYQRPLINFENSYQATGVADPGNELTTSLEVQNAIKTIAENLSTKIINYVIDAQDGEIVVDMADLMTLMGISKWTPIGTPTLPYRGQLIVKNGYVVIKNLVVTESNLPYYGFFGFMTGSNTIIENFKFENAQIEVSGGEEVRAGVVAGYVNFATLSNIYVDYASVTNGYYNGFIAGVLNSGTIKNSFVGDNYEEGKENTLINNNQETVYMGGIVGANKGTVSNVSVANATIRNELRSSLTYMGGIAGILNTGGSIDNAKNEGILVYSDGGKGFFGGIVGNMAAETTIRSSYSFGDITTRIEDDETAVAGGIVGQISSDSTVKTSFAQPNLVKSKYVGGIAAINYGTISESYTLGDFQGAQVGGFTYVNFGTIEHSYTRASVESIGLGGKYTAAGLSVFLPEGGKISYVYSSANLSTQTGARLYAETRTYIRYTDFEYFLDSINIINGDKTVQYNGSNKGGSIKNYIIVNYGTAMLQTTPLNSTKSTDNVSGFIHTTIEDVKGNGASVPMQDAGFYNHTPQTWVFVEGEWPQLINVIANPNDAQ